MNLSIAAGAAGTVWLIVASPQPIFNVFIRNELEISSAGLGLLVGILSFLGLFQVLSILIYSSIRRKKVFWIVTSTLHRLNSFVLMGVSIYAARGGSSSQGFSIILTAMALSWILTNSSAAGWWSWMADLIPETIRARFFGRRSAAANVINVAWFLAATIVIDSFTGLGRFYVYAVIFGIGGLAGVADILLHIFIPEILPKEPPSGLALRDFLEPLRNRNFLFFCLVTGFSLFSINVCAPFIPPYITAEETIGAPTTWLGIMFIISQLTWILIAPPWGVIMDRLGKKPVVLMGLLHTLSWTGYFFITPSNYTYILPLVALFGGLLAPAFWDGINQMMLSLTPEKNRIAYVAWFWTLIGVVSAGGALAGGLLDDLFREVSIPVARGFSLGGFRLLVLTTLVLILVSLISLSRVREGKGKPVFFVFSVVANPGIFRTFMNMGTLTRTSDSEDVVRALRDLEGAPSNLVLEEVLTRLSDPDEEVRDEAARALGRIGGTEALEALVRELEDPQSTVRPEAARALGRIRNPGACPNLIKVMDGANEELLEACIFALGEIGGDEPRRKLLDLFRKLDSDRLIATGASAVSKLGVIEAAWEILPRFLGTENPVVRNQLAIAFGNLLGQPGDFYQYVTGSDERRAARRERLFSRAQKNLLALVEEQEEPLGPYFNVAQAVRHIRNCYEEGMYLLAFEMLEKTADELLKRLVPAGSSQESVLDRTFAVEPRLAVWWWFLQETRKTADQKKEILPVSILLGIYFLAVFPEVHYKRGTRHVG